MAAMDTGIPEHGYSQDGQTDGQSIPLKIKYKIFQLQPIECDVMREEGRSDKHVENTCQTSQQKRQKIASRNTYVRVPFANPNSYGRTAGLNGQTDRQIEYNEQMTINIA